MGGDPSIAGGFFWALQVMSDIAFRWIPGTVQVMSGAVPTDPSSALIYKPITEPVTPADVVHFLQTASVSGAYDKLYHNWTVFVAVGILVSLLLFALTLYCVIRVWQIRQHEESRFAAAATPIAQKDVPKAQLRWQTIWDRAHSDDEKDRRLAILEADIMLNELLDVLGYKGETMADKMKQATRANFRSIDAAWEAHRVRNQVAHQSSLHGLSAQEARRAVGLYAQVFREFRFIE